MKDVMLMLGFGFGLVTGALLYKYSQDTQDFVDESEKKLMKGAKKLEKKAEQGMQELENKVKKGAKKVEQKVKQAKAKAEK